MNEQLIREIQDSIDWARDDNLDTVWISRYDLQELLDTIMEQDNELKYWSNR